MAFSALTQRFIKGKNKGVLILVHKEELLHQARETLYEWDEISAFPIMAGIKHIPKKDCYVAMAETINNRLKKFPELFEHIGLVIVDEAHIATHHKVLEFFPKALIAGFTATPITASKKKPLNTIFEEIVCCIDIPELIEINKGNPNMGLLQDVTYHIKGSVDRKQLHMLGGDFNTKEMGDEFSKAKHITNTVEAYRNHAYGTKTMVFNCNIEHSLLVNQAFLDAGFNSRHIDSEMCDKDPAYRAEIKKWLKETPDAICNNVALMTTGFNEPSIETIIMNRSTASEPLWLQCCGRGSRIYPGKKFFTVIDLGGNAMTHGLYSHRRNWREKFLNPAKPKKDGVAPIKECPNCEALIAAQATVCKFCNHEMPRNPEGIQDALPVEFELVTKNINVHELIGVAKQRNMKEYAPFFKIGEVMARSLKNHVTEVSPLMFEKLLEQYLLKAREWRHANGKKMNQWHRDRAKEHLEAEVKKHFPNFNVPLEVTHVH